MGQPRPSNGISVGDVALLVNRADGEEGDNVGAALSALALLWLQMAEWIPGRRSRWALTASRDGQQLARRMFPSRREAEAARQRIAAQGAFSDTGDWQALLDAA